MKKLVIGYFPRPRVSDWDKFTINNPEIQALNITAKFGKEFSANMIDVVCKNLPDLEYLTLQNYVEGKEEFKSDFLNRIISSCSKLRTINFTNYSPDGRVHEIIGAFKSKLIKLTVNGRDSIDRLTDYPTLSKQQTASQVLSEEISFFN